MFISTFLAVPQAVSQRSGSGERVMRNGAGSVSLLGEERKKDEREKEQ